MYWNNEKTYIWLRFPINNCKNYSMKKYSLLLVTIFVMITTITKAQYVNIPDSNFRAFLINKYPTCFNAIGQMDTTCSMLVTEYYLNCSNQNIQNLDGIKFFKNLFTLICEGNKLDSLPILPSSLYYLSCSYNGLSTLTNLPSSLQSLICSNNKLATLPNLPISLQELYCSSNLLTTLQGLPYTLTKLDCSFNLLNSLPNLPTNLSSLICNNNKVTSLPTLPNGLYNLICSNNQLTSLPPLTTNISLLDCHNNFITQLPTLPVNLASLYCDHNQLTSLPFLSDNIQLVHCNNNKLNTITNIPLIVYDFNCDSNLISKLPDLSNAFQFSYTYFPNRLSCKSNNISVVPPLPTILDSLNCDNNQLTSLPNIDMLVSLSCKGNVNIKCLPTLPGTLTFLDVSNTGVNCLPNSYLGKVIPYLPVCNSTNNYNSCIIANNYVNIPDSNFRSYLIINYPNCFNTLQQMDTTCSNVLNESSIICSNLNIQNLDGIQYFKRVNRLDCSKNQLINITRFPLLLNILICDHNNLVTLPDFPKFLSSISVNNNHLISLPTLEYLTRFRYLNCDSNQLTSLSNLPIQPNYFRDTSNISAKGNPNLSCLPWLPSSLTFLNVSGTKVNCRPNYSTYLTTIPGGIPLCNLTNNKNSCTAFPTVLGKIFDNVNSNGIKDAGESYIPYIPLRLNNGNMVFTDTSGSFGFSTDSIGTYLLSTIPPNFYKAVPAIDTLNFTSYSNIVTLSDIALQPTVNKDSLSINLIPWCNAIGTATFDYCVFYRNLGTTKLNTTIAFNYDSSKLIYNGSNAKNVTISGNTISWNDSLNTFFFGYNKFGSSNYFDFYFTKKNTVKIGDTLFAKAFINASTVSSVDSIYDIIRSSYDPNDKLATPELTTTQVNSGDYINYTINFQNTGNDTAYNIIIADSLDRLLQANTLEIIGASNNCKTTLQKGTIYFEFKNILLPDSFTNFKNSHGFVCFRVKPVNTVSNGNVITNTASIYFDYNSPILTNTAVTNIVNMTSLPLKLLSFNGVRKNNNEVLLFWNTANENNTQSFIIQESIDGRIFKSIGEVAAIGKNNNSYQFTVNKIDAPIVYYRLIIKDKNGAYTYSEVKQLKMDNGQLIISPNPAKDIVTISGNNIKQLTLVDFTGRAVITKEVNTNSIKLAISNLSKGIYMVKATLQDGSVQTEKMVVE